MKTTITKSQKRLFILLAIVASYAVYDLLTSEPKNKKPATDKAVQSVDAQKAQDPSSAVSNVQSIPVNFPATGWKRDPFRRDKENISRANLNKVIESLLSQRPGNLHLTAISKNGNQSYALINDQILSVGEIIDGYRVAEIRAANVVLKKNDHSFTLVLPEEE